MQPNLIGALLLATTVLGGCAPLQTDESAGQHVSDLGDATADSDGISDIHVFVSTLLGEAVRIRIASPVGTSQGPWPVIYVLDGHYLFGLVTDTVRLLALSGGLTDCIVIGVDVGNRWPLDPTARGRHFTSTPSLVPAQATGLQAAGSEHGGADDFLAFLTNELTLFVSAQYPIDPSRRVLVGDGLAGLFVVHAFLTSNAFTDHLALSPALWWGEGIVFREEAALAERSDDRDARLFIGGGADESATADLDLVTHIETLTSRLQARAYPSLRSKTVILEGETAASVTPAALSRGLRFLLR